MSLGEVWVIGELRGDAPSPWTLQLVSGAAELAGGAGGSVIAVLPGAAGSHVDLLARHGADEVALVDGVEPTSPESMAATVCGAAAPAPPALMLLPDSLGGREVAAQIAAGCDVDVLSACERILVPGDGPVEVTRSCHGGQISQRLRSTARPMIATVREHVFRARELPGRVSAPPTRSLAAQAEERVRAAGRRLPAPDELEITEAEVLVAGGRGVGEDGFTTLQRLAGALGGTVAASRVAVDAGWAPRTRQVGQTGRSVAPRLYLACGISGAIQHMVGVREADALVALNLDERAPIMREADLAAVGDAREVLPRLLQLLDGGGS